MRYSSKLPKRRQLTGSTSSMGIDFIVPECHAQEIVRIGQVNVYRIAFDPEAPTFQIQVVPSVQAVDQAAEEYVTV